MSRLYDSYLDGDIDRAFYKAKNEDLKQQRTALSGKLNSLDVANDKFYENVEQVMRLVLHAPKLFNRSEIDQRRQLIELVLQNLELHGRQLR